MPRVSQDTINKLNAFLNSLPAEARSKCALCNETLTHLVKTAEVETGAGTATVTRALSEKINEGAAPGDRVTDQQLRRRVQRQDDDICPKRADKTASNIPEPPAATDPPCPPVSYAMDFVAIAISQLKRIEKNDPMRVQALNRVKTWVEEQLQS